MNVIEIGIPLSFQLFIGVWLAVETLIDREIGLGRLIAGILCFPGVLVVGFFVGIVWLFEKLDKKVLWRW